MRALLTTAGFTSAPGPLGIDAAVVEAGGIDLAAQAIVLAVASAPEIGLNVGRFRQFVGQARGAYAVKPVELKAAAIISAAAVKKGKALFLAKHLCDGQISAGIERFKQRAAMLRKQGKPVDPGLLVRIIEGNEGKYCPVLAGSLLASKAAATAQRRAGLSAAEIDARRLALAINLAVSKLDDERLEDLRGRMIDAAQTNTLRGCLKRATLAELRDLVTQERVINLAADVLDCRPAPLTTAAAPDGSPCGQPIGTPTLHRSTP